MFVVGGSVAADAVDFVFAVAAVGGAVVAFCYFYCCCDAAVVAFIIYAVDFYLFIYLFVVVVFCGC